MYAAALIAQTLKDRGAVLHTYPGGTIAPIYHECQHAGVPIVRGRNEQGAGYMAIGEAQLTGNVTFCAVTSGPGATNLVTCVADAYYDSVPLVVITGQVGTADLHRSPLLRQRGFQEVPVVDLMATITKSVFQPSSPESLAADLAEAIHLAASGRPGPVVLDLPMNVQLTELDILPEYTPTTGQEPSADGDFDGDVVLSSIEDAERPLILVGAGARLASAEVRAFAERCGIPVVSSVRGLGIVPSEHPLSAGWIGHTGMPWANWALEQADLILTLGSRLDVRQTGTVVEDFAGKTIFHVDLDPTELEHVRLARVVPIHADVRSFLAALNTAPQQIRPRDRSVWVKSIAKARLELPLQDHGRADGVRPDELLRAVNAATKGRQLAVTTGVGSHQQWVARYFTFDHPRRQLFASAGHGTMGYGLPAAIGIKRIAPERLVLSIDGDGSAQMNIQELATVKELDLAVKMLILDNQRLAIVSQFQQITFGADPVTGDFPSPDFRAIGRAYGIPSERMDTLDEDMIAWWLGHDGPALLHVSIQHDAQVSPMLLSGQKPGSMWYVDEVDGGDASDDA